MDRVELGDRVKDKITGLSGVAIGATDWLYGCRRITVQPETEKDGKPVDTFCVDEPQLRITKKAVVGPNVQEKKPRKKRGGPRRDVSQRPDELRR